MQRHAVWLGIGLVAVLLVGWLATGESPQPASQTVERQEIVRVGLTESRAQSIERVLTLQGHAEPEQVVRVRAKTGGEVVETPVAEGAIVAAGDLVARLDMTDRQARLTEARAAEREARGDFEAAERLADQGFQARLQVERTRAALEAARARVAAIELEIAHTRVTAPIGGVLNRQIARRGDFVAEGDPIAEVVENDPLRAVVQIPQHRVTEITEGQSARVTFFDDMVREGEVRYVSAMADERTRTFLARIRVDNPDRDLPAGTSVTVTIPVEQVRAHGVTPALISQDEDGRLGIKVAEKQDGEWRARFVPVKPVRADARQVWVTGLPDQVRLITLGQGFVRDGDRLAVVETNDAAGEEDSGS